MPRQSRAKSECSIYHVMLRGINRQSIFVDSVDYRKFLELAEEYKKLTNTFIYGYCLMKNHVHILLKSYDLSTYMRRLGSGYVLWFNRKYNRIGGLFQDRFKSEPINDDEYFLTALRYIHQNPICANIVKNIDDYIYSSYCDYIRHRQKSIVDIDFVLKILPLNQYIEFHKKESCEKHVEISEIRRVNDEDAKNFIYKICNIDNLLEINTLDKAIRNLSIKKMKEEGLSVRQIERLTGIKRGVILSA